MSEREACEAQIWCNLSLPRLQMVVVVVVVVVVGGEEEEEGEKLELYLQSKLRERSFLVCRQALGLSRAS